jgi:polygalacturonase
MRIPYFHLALLLYIAAANCQAAERRTFPITDFGAVSNDGKTMNTSAFAKAIQAAVDAGGGIVKVPEGKWLTGAIELKSKVTLNLDSGATLLMSTNPADYPVVLTRWEGIECYNYSGLIYARDANHIAITGKGTIDGQGQSWWRWAKSAGPAQRRLRELGESTDDPGQRMFGTAKDALRPNLVQFIHCKDVLLEGVSVRNSPMWTIHPLYCQGVICRGLSISGQGPNTDGIDSESCKGVLIENCIIDTGDDCIALKAGRDKDGRRVNWPCEDVLIRDCKFQRGHGAIAIGSEGAGGIRNITAIHCAMRGTDCGIRIKTMRGRGGVVESITITDMLMSQIQKSAIDINMQYNLTDPKPFDDSTPTIRNIIIDGINCDGAKDAITLRGLAESAIEGLTIKNAQFKTDKGISIEDAVELKLENIELTFDKNGPAIRAERVIDCSVDRLKVARAPKSDPLLTFTNAHGLTIKNTAAPSRTDVFLGLHGPGTKDVILEHCDTSKARQRIDQSEDVPKNAVRE